MKVFMVFPLYESVVCQLSDLGRVVNRDGYVMDCPAKCPRIADTTVVTDYFCVSCDLIRPDFAGQAATAFGGPS